MFFEERCAERTRRGKTSDGTVVERTPLSNGTAGGRTAADD